MLSSNEYNIQVHTRNVVVLEICESEDRLITNSQDLAICFQRHNAYFVLLFKTIVMVRAVPR